MADLHAFKQLMLWACIIGSASSTTPAPMTISSFSPTASSQSTSQWSQTGSLSTATQPTTTTLDATTSEAELSPPQCTFEVSPRKFGLQIDMINVTSAEYDVTYAEKNQKETSKIVMFSNKSSTHEIQRLKPCTEYEVKVAIIYKKEKIDCNCTMNNNTTPHMDIGDIQPGNSIPGYVCYKSKWMPIEEKKRETKELKDEICFKLNIEEICSTITLSFPNVEKCGNSWNSTENITLDFLNPAEIRTEAPTSIPATITPKCPNLSVEYTCTDQENSNVTRNVSDLEPFTSYSCVGRIMDNNVTTNKEISVGPFSIDCGFDIKYSTKNITNTSIALNFTATNKSCMGVPYNRTALTYSCNCFEDGSNRSQKSDNTGLQHHEEECNVTGLSPFRSYYCMILLNYKNKTKSNITTKGIKTSIGIPQVFIELKPTLLENNVIEVNCTDDSKTVFNGPNEGYIARLGDETKPIQKKCSFEFKDLSYSTEYTITVFAYNGKHKSRGVSTTMSTAYNDKAVIGFLVFLIILTSVALLLVLYKIYVLKRRRSHEVGEGMRLISTANDEDSLLSVEPIAAEILMETYNRKMADESRLFFAEFQSIPRIFSRYSVKEAKRTCNAFKNRYVDILPYDYTRVQLNTGNGQAGCDYINASFINGFTEPKKYIAAQGPKTETVCDFWRMIWEQQSSIIVMVTRCEEGNKVKCEQYWPSRDQQTEIFEEFVVKLNSEDLCPDYTIRHLTLMNKREKNSEREVTHIQFMSWPDHGIPGEPQLLLKLRRRVNAFKNLFSGPIVVHCSAGVGRTGTYISIDTMMECLEAEGRVDVYGSVVKLRRQRGHMVQVEPQYILIHQALLEHNQFGETEISLSELHSTLSMLTHKNSDEPTLLQEEFEKLSSIKNRSTFRAGTVEENKKKNRSMSVIPYDYNRVLLRLGEGQSEDSEQREENDDESSDEEDDDSIKYINASHIDGYWGPRAFIVAQTPLTHTVEDFWFMVHQKKVATIIMLSDGSAGDEDEDSVYWDQGKATFGEIEVQLASTDTGPTFITRNFLVRHVKMKESRTVKHVQFLKWGSSELPEKAQELTEMLKSVKVKGRSGKPGKNAPMVVHCNDGSSRSGIVCALWNLWDSAQTEKLVDVFQVVKTLCKQRQGMFPTLGHYQFLYKALENLFPVTNGEAKPAQEAAADSVQVVDETKAEEKPVMVEQPQSVTTDDQPWAADSSQLVIREEDKEEEPSQEPSA